MCDRHDIGPAIQALFAASEQAPPAIAAVAPKVPNRRLKLWELEDNHHCPVVGTCLTLSEIKKIARRSGFNGRDFDEYRLHVEAVSISSTRNDASEAMQKLLDRKFALQIRRFDEARTPEEVLAIWNRHLEQGDVAGALWAALTHRAATKDSRQKVYANVHMLSHQIGAGQAADLRRLESLDREYARLREQSAADAAHYAREIAQKNRRIWHLERDVADVWARAEAVSPLRQRVLALESGVAMTEMARRLMATTDESVRYQERNVLLEARLVEMEAAAARLSADLEAVTRERDAMEQLWLNEVEEDAGCRGDCAACPNSLQGRCVLCVGGRTPLLPQYRQLAERLGVRLIHHDGGKEESLSRLPALLASADAVICPTDCVGHIAYYQLKQHCKQAGKSCVLVKSSGVASFAAALAQLAEGRAAIHPE
jgi:hypothetical protein